MPTPRQIERNADALHKEFPHLFSGKLGKIKDVKVKLDIDDTVRSVRQAQRPIPFHLRAAVEKELLQQEAEGIIERVTQKSGPTPWVANLVIVDKNKKAQNVPHQDRRRTDRLNTKSTSV